MKKDTNGPAGSPAAPLAPAGGVASSGVKLPWSRPKVRVMEPVNNTESGPRVYLDTPENAAYRPTS